MSHDQPPESAVLAPSPDPGEARQRAELASRVRDYLGNGGFFNPEAMEHDKVRQLIIDLAASLGASRPSPNLTAEKFALLIQEMRAVTGTIPASVAWTWAVHLQYLLKSRPSPAQNVNKVEE